MDPTETSADSGSHASLAGQVKRLRLSVLDSVSASSTVAEAAYDGAGKLARNLQWLSWQRAGDWRESAPSMGGLGAGLGRLFETRLDATDPSPTRPTAAMVAGSVCPKARLHIQGIRARIGCKRIRLAIEPFGDTDALKTARDADLPYARFHFRGEIPLYRGLNPVHIEVSLRKNRWLPVASFWARRRKGSIEFGAASHPVPSYPRWIRLYDTWDDATAARASGVLGALPSRPRISIVMPCFNPEPDHFRAAVASVRDQVYPDWELCIADDASTNPRIRPLLEKAASSDPRIKVAFREENGHISAASNSALDLATGEFVAFLDHDDLFRPHALLLVANELAHHPDTDLVYSDEDNIDDAGHRSSPYFKPDWNPELLRGQNYICHLATYRRSLVERAGRLRVGFEGAQDWDLVLRCSELTEPDRIRHIPHVLYHWRLHQASTSANTGAKPYVLESSLKAVRDHLGRSGLPDAEVTLLGDGTGQVRVAYPLPDPPPRVSLLIPTRDRAEVLAPCVRSILTRTDYPDYEIVILDNDSSEPATRALFDELSADPRVRILPFPGAFNYSAINNFGVDQCPDTTLVGLVNNDIEVLQDGGGWLRELASRAALPGAGAIGARLLYPDGTVQHAGVGIGIGGVAGHLYKQSPAASQDYFSRLQLAQEVGAVTAACLVVQRQRYLEVGGLDAENLAVAFNDVDFCLKLRAAGYRNVYTPGATLLHHESVSRGDDLAGEKLRRFQNEVQFMRDKWPECLANDPAYNPNLTVEAEDWGLAFPPRRDILDNRDSQPV